MIKKKDEPESKLVFIAAFLGGILIAGALYQVINIFRYNVDEQCLAALTVPVEHWWEQQEPECTPNFVDDTH